ncbi:hypothetical protein CDO73_04690 [Saccharibacillus sp. O23]|uniref:response regulator n=1 Tax=Saccharibacillus sp. O23 TaxID=2009338 RepID=UPI000B4E5DB1|nr:response regulator [Saccharibacillus sp. O23]OWR31782.1 hypothetical protein CDO73_04690 [Saccharibacillus sp. O23]
MRAMLIDDEQPALMHLERLLRADGRIEPAALCMSAREGLERLAREPIDVVFLDIGMPEMNGLEAAEHIQQAYSRIAIVFVTAYSEYAVEAFELQAIDYLLKPIGAPRLRKAIDRLVPQGTGQTVEEDREPPAAEKTNAPSAPADSSPRDAEKGPDILTFGRLELADSASGQAYPIKWRTAKIQELFAYLLHGREQWVRRDELIEWIWPNVSPEKAATHLHTSVYRLRKILNEWAPQMKLEYRQESYRLLRGGAETDAERLEREAASLAAEDADRAERLLPLWRGDYLAHHDYAWAKSRAADLKRLCVQLALYFAEDKRINGKHEEAIRHLSALQTTDPFNEEICRLLMRTHAELGDKRGVRECYQMLRQRLEEDLGVEPERQTEELYEQLEN